MARSSREPSRDHGAESGDRGDVPFREQLRWTALEWIPPPLHRLLHAGPRDEGPAPVGLPEGRFTLAFVGFDGGRRWRVPGQDVAASLPRHGAAQGGSGAPLDRRGASRTGRPRGLGGSSASALGQRAAQWRLALRPLPHHRQAGALYPSYFWAALVAGVERKIEGADTAWGTVLTKVADLSAWRVGFADDPRWGSSPRTG